MCQIEALKKISFCYVRYFLRVRIRHGECSFGADEECWFYDVVSDSRATVHAIKIVLNYEELVEI